MGILTTILLTVVSFVFILLVGIIGGMGRIAKNPVIHFVATIYVEIFRGIPLLVQLIWWYFAAPVVIRSVGGSINFTPLADYQSNAFVLAVVGLVICYGAYMSEIFRAGIQSIPKGQMEAARSQGMTYLQAMRYVVLPQAIRVVMPPVGNEFIMLIKDTSLVSAVAVADLTRRGREFMSTHFNPIETWTMVALLYLVMTLFFTRIIAWLEKTEALRKVSMTEPIIQIENVHKYFGRVHALRGVSLDVSKGEVVVILGPSGSGKSTLLRCINHLEVYNSGKIVVDGILLEKRPEHQRRPARSGHGFPVVQPLSSSDGHEQSHPGPESGAQTQC